MAHRRRVADLLRGRLLALLLARQFPAVNDLEAVERRLVFVAQRVIGGVHVREARVAAVGRHRHGVQDRRERRLRPERFVGVPGRRLDRARRTPVRPQVRHHVDPRIVAAAIARDVPFERAELLAERDLLVFRQLLVAERHHVIAHERVVHLMPHRFGQGPAQIEPDDLGREQRRQLPDREILRRHIRFEPADRFRSRLTPLRTPRPPILHKTAQYRSARQREANPAGRADAAAYRLRRLARRGRQANLIELPRAAAAQHAADNHRPHIADHPGITLARAFERGQRDRLREIAGKLHAPRRERGEPVLVALARPAAAASQIGDRRETGPRSAGSVAVSAAEALLAALPSARFSDPAQASTALLVTKRT